MCNDTDKKDQIHSFHESNNLAEPANFDVAEFLRNKSPMDNQRKPASVMSTHKEKVLTQLNEFLSPCKNKLMDSTLQSHINKIVDGACIQLHDLIKLKNIGHSETPMTIATEGVSDDDLVVENESMPSSQEDFTLNLVKDDYNCNKNVNSENECNINGIPGINSVCSEEPDGSYNINENGKIKSYDQDEATEMMQKKEVEYHCYV